MAQNANITRTSILKFVLLPGILPRFGNIFKSGFANLSYFMAIVFNMLQILPNRHPYLLSRNRGRFSLLQVLREGASHIPFDRKNIDKVTIFFVMIAGIVMLVLQMVLLVLAVITGKAMAYAGPGAGPQTLGDFFDNDNTQNDIAFRMLDLVFGVQGVFNSREMGTSAFHEGLHALFQFYSYGILLVGVFIIIYLTIRVVLETAQSGTPFGERFNHAWVPVRLILFFGLLIPMTSGLNLAQVIVLESARLGSNLATNGWLAFDAAVTNATYLGPADDLIAEPTPPDLDNLASFMQIAKACQYAENSIYPDEQREEIRGYVVFGAGTPGSPFYDLADAPAFTDLAAQAGASNIFIRFGVQDEEKYPKEKGTVYPFCGELTMSVVDLAQAGAIMMQQGYLDLVSCFWNGNTSTVSDPREPGQLPTTHENPYSCQNLYTQVQGNAVAYYNKYYDGQDVNMRWRESVNSRYRIARMSSLYINEVLSNARTEQIANGDWLNDAAMEMGWGGAGIWFNKIAEQNGSFTAAVFAKPDITLMPSVMEFVRKTKLANNANTPMSEMYVPELKDNTEFPFNPTQDKSVAIVLMHVFDFWGDSSNIAYYQDRPETHNAEMGGNIIIDMVNMLMGTQGLFDMCKQTNVHPLAQLASVGKGLVEHSIRAFAFAAGTGIGSGLLSLMQKHNWAQVLEAASAFFMKFAIIGLMLGFILFYVIPFMPFIYFFFAVMTWVKSIFEAMVAMPLWALAHLNLEGEGMPGQAATNGYFHILEIFLRPICILIGLLGGIAVFTSMVKVLNQIFYLLISNMTGHYVPAGDSATGVDNCFTPPGMTASEDDPQQQDYIGSTVDEFFYTIMYAIIVYMISVPCFKMVDLVPDNIMRWMGTGINSFGSQDGDPADNLIRNISVGAGGIGRGMSQGLGSVSNSVKSMSNGQQ